MSTCEVRACRVGEIFDDPLGAGLFAAYGRECSNPVIGSTAPERAMYESLEHLDMARCFAARVDQALCGFAFVLAAAVPHFGRHLATVESLFVGAEGRRSGLGTMLMHAVEGYARERGCSAIFYSAPVGSRLAKLLFLKKAYCKTNHIFTKALR